MYLRDLKKLTKDVQIWWHDFVTKLKIGVPCESTSGYKEMMSVYHRYLHASVWRPHSQSPWFEDQEGLRSHQAPSHEVRKCTKSLLEQQEWPLGFLEEVR